MSTAIPKPPLKLAILQRVCTGYRVPLFRLLSSSRTIETMLFLGDDVPDSKIKNASNLDGIRYRRIKTRFIRFGSRILPWHAGLIRELRQFSPDVILCEGESHFIGYVQAICYRLLFKRSVALMHWCYISLPGWSSVGGKGYRALLKRFFRNFFDAFVVYSSFSRDNLAKLGQPSEKIFVATNVGDVERFLNISKATTTSVPGARAILGLPDRFTVLYAGTLDANKRPEIMLELAGLHNCSDINFVLLGSGDLFEQFRDRIGHQNLANVFLPGRVADTLPLYFRASDVLLVPGRGGIIISEALASGLPVIVHEADGTEYDLVEDGVTGLRIRQGHTEEFLAALTYLRDNPERQMHMRAMSTQRIKDHFTTKNMVDQIVCAANYAVQSRRACGTIQTAK